MVGHVNYFLKKTVKTFRALLYKSGWERDLYYLQCTFPDEIERRSEYMFFKRLNILIKKNQFDFVRVSYSTLRLFADHGKVQFKIDDDLFFIYWNGLKLNPTTAEEIFIIQEIFVLGTYNFRSSESYVVIDIGMNVAFASLFFASNTSVKKVYGFEPFKPTYQQAQVNIQSNVEIANKIECFSYGLSDKAETLTVNYTYENKGQVGIYGTDLIRSKIDTSEKSTITLLPVNEELKTIYERHGHQRFILKVDCEGAEYAIFKSLAEHSLLDNVDIVFIEWHEEGPEVLLDILAQNNFKAFYQQAAEKKVGMIYASR